MTAYIFNIVRFICLLLLLVFTVVLANFIYKSIPKTSKGQIRTVKTYDYRDK